MITAATPAKVLLTKIMGRPDQEIVATKTMLERVEEAHGIVPRRLAADNMAAAHSLAWLNERKVTPHIPVLDGSSRLAVCSPAKPLPSIL